MITNKLPTLDVHGETRDTVVYPVKEFIYDNLKMKNRYVVIIHGNGQILKNKVQELLKKEPQVKEFCFDGTNLGATIITLNVESKFDN